MRLERVHRGRRRHDRPLNRQLIDTPTANFLYISREQHPHAVPGVRRVLRHLRYKFSNRLQHANNLQQQCGLPNGRALRAGEYLQPRCQLWQGMPSELPIRRCQ